MSISVYIFPPGADDDYDGTVLINGATSVGGASLDPIVMAMAASGRAYSMRDLDGCAAPFVADVLGYAIWRASLASGADSIDRDHFATAVRIACDIIAACIEAEPGSVVRVG